MFIFNKEFDKKRLIRYGIYALIFIILAVLVSLSAIWIKYKIIDYEVMNTEPGTREYSRYYNSLNYKEQLLYDLIIDGATELEAETEVLNYSYTMEDFQKIIHCIRADRPELFYIDYDRLVLYHSNHRTKVGMLYLADASKIGEMTEAYNAAVDKAMEHIPASMTDFEKELAVNDYITDNCNYALDKSDVLSSTAYGALVQGSAFCDGYAYAAKQLFDRARIDSLVIYGEADSQEHVWNMAEIDSQFYHLDVMWNDGNLNTENKLRFHGYFNLSDELIKLDHSYKDDYGVLPVAPTDNNYYKQVGAYCESTESLEDVFYTQLMKAVEQKREYIELFCLESKDNEVIGIPYNAALKRVNEELGYDALYKAFSVYEASAKNNSVTIQIFYN